MTKYDDMSRLTRNELAKLLELIEHPGVPVHPEFARGEIIDRLRYVLRRMLVPRVSGRAQATGLRTTERGAWAKADGGAS